MPMASDMAPGGALEAEDILEVLENPTATNQELPDLPGHEHSGLSQAETQPYYVKLLDKTAICFESIVGEKEIKIVLIKLVDCGVSYKESLKNLDFSAEEKKVCDKLKKLGIQIKVDGERFCLLP
ncbi:uncharacterized protein LOC143835456 [Paroedura picta]|uniref:uncharacterized protein LOC143835456 n=1 Tax=Paroedura picta TaxID=143630 RepID=UPI0040571911